MIKLNFDIKKHLLPNGLEILTIKKDTQISSINIGIKVGALYEKVNEKGISHFIEHMLFKGTNKRTFQALNDELEALGGEYNAYTDFTSTVYSISCLEEELINGIEILSDMVTSSVFLQEEIEKERGVILAEIRTSKDSVEDLSFKRANEVAFKKGPLRYDVAGVEKNVKKFNHKDLYTFYKKHPAKCGFQSIDEGIESVLKETFVRDEVLQILKYNRKHISFVAGRNEYSYLCPLDLHCRYNTNQIMAAFGLFTETESPEFREGVKRFENKKTDIFFINLNKSEKDFSPSTMYEDYAINDKLFHWQSQSQDRQASAKIQRYINHKNTGDIISLFVREFKRIGSYTAPYTFLGNADYVKHEGERPVSFVWKLHNSIPANMLPKANKSIAL